jgi:hypothetical protein
VSEPAKGRGAIRTGKWAIIAAALIEAVVIALFIWHYRR